MEINDLLGLKYMPVLLGMRFENIPQTHRNFRWFPQGMLRGYYRNRKHAEQAKVNKCPLPFVGSWVPWLGNLPWRFLPLSLRKRKLSWDLFFGRNLVISESIKYDCSHPLSLSIYISIVYLLASIMGKRVEFIRRLLHCAKVTYLIMLKLFFTWGK